MTSLCALRRLSLVAALFVSLVVVSSAGAVVALDVVPACTISGGPAGETLVGTSGADVICGAGGNDRLLGKGGADVLRGEDGNDALVGGAGADVFEGGAGQDTASYEDAAAVVVSIGDGANDGTAAEGDDVRGDVERVQGSDHDDQLTGDAGPNALYGRGGVDQLDGGGGNDGLRGGPGADVLKGGDGAEDIADYSARTVALTVTVGDGANDGEASENDDVQADVEVVRGGSAGDALSGGGGANRLNGRGSADVLDGGDGDDELIGMGGGDTFVGGTGIDLVDYEGETSAVTASVGGGANDGTLGEGDDIGGDVEDIGGGSGNDLITGDGAANGLYGRGGDDQLNGLAGADFLRGVAGADTINGGDDSDTVLAGKGDDTVHVEADDPSIDTVECGSGTDKAFADAADVLDADCENQPPDTTADTVTVAEDDAPAAVDVLANDSDPEGQTLSIASFDDTGTTGVVSLLAGTLSYGPNGQFESLGAGDNGSDSFTYKANDGTVDSAATNVSVTVTGVNDKPVVDTDAAGALTYPEQNGYTNLFGANATITDVDSNTLDSLVVTITSGFDASFDDVRLDPAVAGFTSDFTGGVLTLTRAGGTIAQFQDALRNIQFRNTDDDPDDRNDGTANPAVADRTVSVVADDGPDTSTPVGRDITITPINDAPGAPTPLPSVNSIRNTTLVSGTTTTEPNVTRTVDLESNSTDPDGLESAITVVPAAAAATVQGGRITLNAAGDLRYEPPASVTLNADSYGYQLTDGITASSAITFTVNLAGEVWYVADQAPGPNDGTAARPFAGLAAALAVATTNDAIHIRRAPGDGTLTGGVTLQTGQKLIGEGVALTNTDIGTATAETLFAAGTKPVLTASGTDVVTLASNAEVAGVSVNPDGAASGITGASTSGVTLRSMEIVDSGIAASQPGLELTSTGNGLALSGNVDVAMQSNKAIDINGAALAARSPTSPPRLRPPAACGSTAPAAASRSKTSR